MIPIAKPYLTEDEAQAAYDTILSGWITQGPRVAEFEKKFAAKVGAKYAVAVSNCTTALHLSLIISDVGIGDEVICPSMTYVATANAIRYTGATPVFAEVEKKNYNLDCKDVIRKITSKTKAILLVHQIGMPANIDEFKAICEKHNLILIEDAACAIGSKYKGGFIGSHSKYVCFSFHPRKVISTGDGGMVATNSEEVHQRLKLLRQHAMSINDRVRHESSKILLEDHIEVGYNYRMTDIQASVGIKQLEKLDFIVNERRKIAQKYNKAFKSIKGVNIPIEEDGYESNFQSYSLNLDKDCRIERNELMQQLLDLGIASRRGIMTIHRETAYKNKFEGSLPVSEEASDRSILLPLYVPMLKEDQQEVINAVTKILSK
jgi:perosamine synthetase